MVCFKAKYDAKPLPKLLEEGKKGENPSSLLLFKNRKEGSFGSFFKLLCLWNGYGVFHNAIVVFDKGKMSLKLWFNLFSWGFLKGISLCVEKERNFGVMLGKVNYSLNSCFKFNFKMFICSFKRLISPQASNGFKFWEIDAIVGRLCQNFCKNLRKKLQQHK